MFSSSTVNSEVKYFGIAAELKNGLPVSPFFPCPSTLVYMITIVQLSLTLLCQSPSAAIFLVHVFVMYAAFLHLQDCKNDIFALK